MQPRPGQDLSTLGDGRCPIWRLPHHPLLSPTQEAPAAASPTQAECTGGQAPTRAPRSRDRAKRDRATDRQAAPPGLLPREVPSGPRRPPRESDSRAQRLAKDTQRSGAGACPVAATSWAPRLSASPAPRSHASSHRAHPHGHSENKQRGRALVPLCWGSRDQPGEHGRTLPSPVTALGLGQRPWGSGSQAGLQAELWGPPEQEGAPLPGLSCASASAPSPTSPWCLGAVVQPLPTPPWHAYTPDPSKGCCPGTH